MNMLCKIWFFVGITVENKKNGVDFVTKKCYGIYIQ